MVNKRTIKYGGRSGILPKPRPMFKRFPIRPKTEAELAEESKHEQGFKGVPLPKRKGFTFHAEPQQKPVFTVEERIKKFIDARAPQNIDELKLSDDELWQVKRDEIRRAHLREAYLTEAARLKRVDEKKEKLAREKAEQVTEDSQPEQDSASLTLPTIQLYLEGLIVRRRTPEEKALLEELRELNRNTARLEVREAKATSLLELYHAAAKFITTEEELEQAIHEAFNVNFSSYDNAELKVLQMLKNDSFYPNIAVNDELIRDAALGEIRGQPGLEVIKDTLSGEAEWLKRQAQIKNNESRLL